MCFENLDPKKIPNVLTRTAVLPHLPPPSTGASGYCVCIPSPANGRMKVINGDRNPANRDIPSLKISLYPGLIIPFHVFTAPRRYLFNGTGDFRIFISDPAAEEVEIRVFDKNTRSPTDIEIGTGVFHAIACVDRHTESEHPHFYRVLTDPYNPREPEPGCEWEPNVHDLLCREAMVPGCPPSRTPDTSSEW